MYASTGIRPGRSVAVERTVIPYVELESVASLSSFCAWWLGVDCCRRWICSPLGRCPALFQQPGHELHDGGTAAARRCDSIRKRWRVQYPVQSVGRRRESRSTPAQSHTTPPREWSQLGGWLRRDRGDSSAADAAYTASYRSGYRGAGSVQ